MPYNECLNHLFKSVFKSTWNLNLAESLCSDRRKLQTLNHWNSSMMWKIQTEDFDSDLYVLSRSVFDFSVCGFLLYFCKWLITLYLPHTECILVHLSNCWLLSDLALFMYIHFFKDRAKFQGMSVACASETNHLLIFRGIIDKWLTLSINHSFPFTFLIFFYIYPNFIKKRDSMYPWSLTKNIICGDDF